MKFTEIFYYKTLKPYMVVCVYACIYVLVYMCMCVCDLWLCQVCFSVGQYTSIVRYVGIVL